MRMSVLMGFAVAMLSACGGGDDSGPSTPQYPNVAGFYNLSGTIDGLTPQEASIAGTVQLTQATLESGVLGGNFQVTATIDGSVVPITSAFASASVTQGGAVTWTISNNGISWQFSGNSSGATMSGRHTLSDGAQSFAGDWNANRTSSIARMSASSGQLDVVFSGLRRAHFHAEAMSSRSLDPKE
jgi:hypothetical protein